MVKFLMSSALPGEVNRLNPKMARLDPPRLGGCGQLVRDGPTTCLGLEACSCFGVADGRVVPADEGGGGRPRRRRPGQGACGR